MSVSVGVFAICLPHFCKCLMWCGCVGWLPWWAQRCWSGAVESRRMLVRLQYVLQYFFQPVHNLAACCGRVGWLLW